MAIGDLMTMKQKGESVTRSGIRRGNTSFASRMYRPVRISLVLFMAIAQLFIPRIAAGQGDSVGEYELKAAMLYNLTRFVEWPPSAYPNPATPTLLCILGRDPFGSSLASLLSGQGANSRPVQIRHFQNGNGIRACHVLYVSSSERKNVAQILSLLKGSSVLTVGEMTQFAAHGGMIQFSLVERQVRFDINLEAASQADLKLSSRLLVLARIVTRKGDDSVTGSWAVGSRAVEFAKMSPRTTRGQLPAGSKYAGVLRIEGEERRWSA